MAGVTEHKMGRAIARTSSSRPKMGLYICKRCTRSWGRNAEAILCPRTIHILPRHRRYTTKLIPQDERPFRMAVIGSGPAGFYTAYKVMSKIKDSKVDMYEHLPTPFGLVRYGVAPDHPEVKNCQGKFQEVAESPNFNFIGNIKIGFDPSSLPLKDLLPQYDAILFAYGASRDKQLGIPGEHLKGIYSARAFVGWYNGLPEYADLAPDLSRGEEAVVIGQGNVALDVARMLLSDVERLRETDITEEALDVLGRSRVKRVRVLGRRGPGQAAFTIKEIRELLNLSSKPYFNPISPNLLPSNPDAGIPLPRAQKRLLDILWKGSASSPRSDLTVDQKSWSLDFLVSPSQFSSDDFNATQLATLTCQNNQFSNAAEVLSQDAKIEAIPDDFTTFSAQVAFRSIGYKSEALPGFDDPEVEIPFDNRRGIILNDGIGRVVASEGEGRHVPGMYCAGWVKRGPTGVIASTMADAFATADAIASDWHSRSPLHFLKGDGAGWENLREEAERRGCRRVSWQDWMRIDGEERRRGREMGKERVKFRSAEDMLAVLD